MLDSVNDFPTFFIFFKSFDDIFLKVMLIE